MPFLVTNKGYGLLWDNPSRTTIEPGFNEQTRWKSEVGDRVSFFVITGNTMDEIYAGYRLLTGPAPMLPKAAYGYIQCKQRYASQDELMAVAKGYRDRHLPADVLVVDWFYYTKMGQMDLDPKFWPDPEAMNKQLHDMGFETMISVWPRFVPDDRFYAELRKKGWLIHLADGTPIDGLPYDRAGSDIDTTNPDAARWYWKTIHDNILSQGFDSLWADETEPDLPPNGAYFHVGPGTEFFNVYPLFHTGALYDGFRRDEPQQRALILSRDAYLGVQSKGTIVWSSDIFPTWDTLKRQIPTGLDVTASGIPYWSNDTGGWQYLPAVHHPAHKPLLDPSDARATVGGYDDYPELYTRWFQYATFLPIFRTHGSRPANEVWSYGKQAEPILEKYLRLRYQLMPYIYSLGYKTWLDRRAHHARLAPGFSQRPARSPTCATSTCSARRFWWPRSPNRAQPAAKSICRPEPTGTTSGPASGSTAGRRLRSSADRYDSAVCARRIHRSARSPVESTHEAQSIDKVRVYPGPRRLHSVLRRRHDLRLRKRGRRGHKPRLERRDRQAHSHRRWRLDRSRRFDRRSCSARQRGPLIPNPLSAGLASPADGSGSRSGVRKPLAPHRPPVPRFDTRPL